MIYTAATICTIFAGGKTEKTQTLAWNFPLFWAGSLVVCESRDWRDRISDKNSQKRSQLRWLGHASRMPFDRLPRRMLSSWFPALIDGKNVFQCFECFWVSLCILDGKNVFQCFWSDPKTRVFECFSEVLYCFCHLGSPHQDAHVPQRWPMAERWKKLWRLSTLTLKIGTSLLLIAKSGTQWSNDVSFCADHTRMEYIHATPLLYVLSLFPFSFWRVVKPMLRGRSWYKLTN